MPIELKDITEYLGINAEEIDSIDKFKEKFDTEFIRSSAISEDFEPIKKIVGKKFGSLETELKRLSGQYGVEWTGDEYKDKSLSDRVKLSMDKLITESKNELEEYKKVNGGGKEEVIKEWTTKYDKLKNEKSDYEKLLEATKQEFEGFKGQVENEKKSYKINFEKENGLKDFKWKTGTNEFTKKGFMSELNEKYKLDLSTEGKLVVLDAQGKQIPNPKTAGTFMGWKEVVESEALKAELYETNPHAGQPVRQPQGSTQPIHQPQGGQVGVKQPFIHPSALR